MRRMVSVPLWGVMLGIGFGLGLTAAMIPWSSAVQADPTSSRDTDRIDAELGGDRNPLLETSRTLARISALTSPSVVHIQSARKSERRNGGVVEETGSGAVIAHPKVTGLLVVTNRHVLVAPTSPDDSLEMKAVSIQLSDGRVVHPTRLWSDRATDVAILQLPDSGSVPPLRLGDSDAVEIGNMVLAMGSPFGLTRSVTLGIISAKGRRSLKLGSEGSVLNQDFLQTDAAINPGNSGGPLIDLRGRIVGINTAIASNSGGNEGIGFSIPSNLIRQVIDQLLEHGHVQRAYLGVKLDPDFDTAAANRLKLDRARGARVVEAYPNTPAQRAGLKFDDVVLSFDGIDVQDENHLINLVSLTPVGRQVRLAVYREGKRITLQVLLADRSELEQRSEPAERPGVGVPVKPMGLTLHQLDRSVAPQLGFTETQQGLVVLSIDSASPFAGKLQLYDLIQEVAGQPVRNVSELQRVLSTHASQRSIVLRIARRVDNRQQELAVVWER